jgi:[ribosomal protein S5]-alanine N-acetyltransferase
LKRGRLMNSVKEMLIETERLVIRPYKKEDLEECFKLMQNHELFKYLDMEVMSFEEYNNLFDWLIDCYEVEFNKDFKYSFNIILKENGKHIGWCGIGGVEFDHQQKEIYYLIGRDYWGKGYAKEASAALLDYGFNIIGLKEIIGLCQPENIASKKVLENIGLKFRGYVQGLSKEFDFYNDEYLYSIKRDEYLQK